MSESGGSQLDHERLDGYHLARELARKCRTLLKQVPPGRADLVDQCRRTTMSVPLNIAEGAGEFAPKEKARFYRMARRSATETAAILDHMVDLELLHPTEVAAAKVLLRRIIGALVRLILSTQRVPEESKGPIRKQRPPAPPPPRTRASASNP